MNKSEKFWDRLAKKFDKRVKKYFEQNYNRIIENTKKYLTVKDNVLDFACGTGIITCDIAGKVKKIHAIDISSKMIDAAKRKADERKIENINFIQSTIFDVKPVRESFDVVLAFNVLHLIEDAPVVMQRMNELLKPGGLVITSTVCMGGKKSIINIIVYLLVKIGVVPYIQFYNISELEDTITNGNFQIIQIERLSHGSTDYFIAAKKIVKEK